MIRWERNVTQWQRIYGKLKIFELAVIGFIFTVHRIVKASTLPRFFLKIEIGRVCAQRYALTSAQFIFTASASWQ